VHSLLKILFFSKKKENASADRILEFDFGSKLAEAFRNQIELNCLNIIKKSYTKQEKLNKMC